MLTKVICVGGPLDREITQFTSSYDTFYTGAERHGYRLIQIGDWKLAISEGISLAEALNKVFCEYGDKPRSLVQPVSLQGRERSPKWDKFAKQFLENHPTCAGCGTSKHVVPHHIRPFHLYPELELEKSNLITLCNDYYVCHFRLGHSKNWSAWNPHVIGDAQLSKERIQMRLTHRETIV